MPLIEAHGPGARPRIRRRAAVVVAAAATSLALSGCSTPWLAGSWPAAGARNGFARVVEGALPSVVGIYALPRRAAGRPAPLSLEDDLLDPPQVGAGFLLDAGGTVATAAHVVEDTDCVVVRFADGRVARADVLAQDPDSDVALLAVPPGLAPSAKLGRSSLLRPGDWVLAVGEPFGLGLSVSAGIVGSVDRHFVEDDEVVFIQSDVSINPGNSGGPLLDARGAIVGMNVRILAGQFGTSGLSLSLPIELVMRSLKVAQHGDGVSRPRLGAEFVDVPPWRSLADGRSDSRGALIRLVRQGSAAEAIGLLPDDIVVAFNGRQVDSSAGFTRLLLASPVDRRTRLEVLRSGERVQLPPRAAAGDRDAAGLTSVSPAPP